MVQCYTFSRFILLLQILPYIIISSSTAIPIDSIDETEWTLLEQSLSPNANLYGPLSSNSYSTCLTLGTNAYAISDAANGLCMHSHECRYEFCTAGQSFDLPSYTVDVRTPEDIAAVLTFAQEKELPVSVKTTGHSYTGSSTQAGSIMIWMHNYPKDGMIQTNFENSCGVVTDAVVGIGGGEVWDDVLDHVKGDYHVVTGGGRTVSAAGGWLMGGGLSFTSREYGIGVDQVVEFDVVLADGSIRKVDACSDPDLFWALRGGGGGTFAVVTHVQYKLHPVTEIQEVFFDLYGYGTSDEGNSFYRSAVLQWIRYWIKMSPTLDTRWGGFFDIGHALLLFAGSMEDAKETFLNEFEDWFETKLIKSDNPFVYGSGLDTRSHENWYEYKGGDAAKGNPDMTDQTGVAYDGINVMAARLVPEDFVVNRGDEIFNLLISEDVAPYLGYVNYYLGGNINEVGVDETSVHPALRSSIWSLFTINEVANQRVRDLLSNDITGVCYNHHNSLEPDWRNVRKQLSRARFGFYGLKTATTPLTFFNILLY